MTIVKQAAGGLTGHFLFISMIADLLICANKEDEDNDTEREIDDIV